MELSAKPFLSVTRARLNKAEGRKIVTYHAQLILTPITNSQLGFSNSSTSTPPTHKNTQTTLRVALHAKTP